ncbi:hypothetical protein Syun_029651 [Stephania yunnanensis]|uniref:Uncharacterized protein n=1 Tax=Stephania yunnanensis TaxID=152371 RepID=A0AAP0EAF8_9MAGN
MADQEEGLQRPEPQGNLETEDQWKYRIKQQMRELMESQTRLMAILMAHIGPPIQ